MEENVGSVDNPGVPDSISFEMKPNIFSDKTYEVDHTVSLGITTKDDSHSAMKVSIANKEISLSSLTDLIQTDFYFDKHSKFYICTICTKAYKQILAVKEHVVSHITHLNLACIKCDYITKYFSSMRKHMLKVHKITVGIYERSDYSYDKK